MTYTSVIVKSLNTYVNVVFQLKCSVILGLSCPPELLSVD